MLLVLTRLSVAASDAIPVDNDESYIEYRGVYRPFIPLPGESTGTATERSYVPDDDQPEHRVYPDDNDAEYKAPLTPAVDNSMDFYPLYLQN